MFKIENLVTKKTHVVHASRLKFYREDSLRVTQELLDYVSSQGELIEIEEIQDFRWNKELKRYELKVAWLGVNWYEYMSGTYLYMVVYSW